MLNGNRISTKSAQKSKKGKKSKTAKLARERTNSAPPLPELHQPKAQISTRKMSQDNGDGEQEKFVQVVQPTNSLGTHPDLQHSRIALVASMTLLGPSLDRLIFRCALGWCRRAITDADELVKICNGCGPYSWTRYCSIGHILDDAGSHYFFCGLDTMKVPLAYRSFPARYGTQLPQILDTHGHDNAIRTRQLIYSIHDEYSDYTVFLDDPLDPVKLTWPETSDTGLTRNIFRRLLNIAFLSKETPFTMSNYTN